MNFLHNLSNIGDEIGCLQYCYVPGWTLVRQIYDPSLPLTNNEAERMLRHWVIDRRLSYGTRTVEGTRSFTLLASVIETCRIRGAPLWDYLTKVITAARKGLELPSLPMMQA
jgi:hypothetical protein